MTLVMVMLTMMVTMMMAMMTSALLTSHDSLEGCMLMLMMIMLTTMGIGRWRMRRATKAGGELRNRNVVAGIKVVFSRRLFCPCRQNACGLISEGD